MSKHSPHTNEEWESFPYTYSTLPYYVYAQSTQTSNCLNTIFTEISLYLMTRKCMAVFRLRDPKGEFDINTNKTNTHAQLFLTLCKSRKDINVLSAKASQKITFQTVNIKNNANPHVYIFLYQSNINKLARRTNLLVTFVGVTRIKPKLSTKSTTWCAILTEEFCIKWRQIQMKEVQIAVNKAQELWTAWPCCLRLTWIILLDLE